MRAPWYSSWSPIGVEVSGRYINAAQLRGSGNRQRLEACASIRRRDPDVPVEPAEIGLLANTLERMAFRGSDVVVAMPSEQLMLDVLELPASKEGRHANRLVRAELAKRHNWAERGFELASWELPQPGRQSSIRRLMAVACPHQASNPFLDAFESAGLEVRALDLQSWALARLCSMQSSGDVEGRTLSGVLSLGWAGANLVVLDEDVVVYVRTLNNVGLNRLHLSLCSKMNLESDVSEYIVREFGMDEAAEAGGEPPRLQSVRRQLATFSGQLIGELRRSLSYVVQEFPDTPIDRLNLVGEGASIQGLGKVLSNGLGLKANPLAPTDVFECGQPSLSERGREPMLSAAVGLATW